MEEKFTLGNTEIIGIENEKFKTAVADVTFFDALSKERAYKNGLLANVLRSGTENYKNTAEIEKRLKELYGAEIFANTEKLGEVQLIHFSLLFTEEKYLGTDENLFEKAIELLTETVYRPFTENGCFSKEIFEREKENYNDEILSEFNDKQYYALSRLNEIAFEGEPFAVSPRGKVEDGEGIDEKNLYDYYKNYFLKKLKVKIFCHTSENAEKIKKIIEEKHYFSEEQTEKTDIGFRKFTEREPLVKEERFDCSQAKLNICFKTDIAPDSSDSFAMMTANVIYGTGFNSMLNKTIREKNSLAYYISSSYEKSKGCVTVYCGIDEKNREKTEALIDSLLEDLKKGKFKKRDLESAKKKYKSALAAKDDSQYAFIDFAIARILYNDGLTKETMYENLMNVTKKDVMRAASTLKKDCVLLIGGTEKKDGDA